MDDVGRFLIQNLVSYIFFRFADNTDVMSFVKLVLS